MSETNQPPQRANKTAQDQAAQQQQLTDRSPTQDESPGTPPQEQNPVTATSRDNPAY